MFLKDSVSHVREVRKFLGITAQARLIIVTESVKGGARERVSQQEVGESAVRSQWQSAATRLCPLLLCRVRAFLLGIQTRPRIC